MNLFERAPILTTGALCAEETIVRNVISGLENQFDPHPDRERLRMAVDLYCERENVGSDY
jgi:hypothetical protein